MELSRREMLVGAVSSVALTRRQTAPIQLAQGVHLFIDDYLIARQSGIQRSIKSPARLPEPIVTGKEDGCFQPYLSVIRDPQCPRCPAGCSVRA